MNLRLLAFTLSMLVLSSLSAQHGITVSGLFHQPYTELNDQGFWAGPGVKAQFLGKEALRGFPIRLQTGLSAAYLHGMTRRLGSNFNGWNNPGMESSVTNHLTRFGASLRALTWPARIRLFAEVEAGAQFAFSTGKNLIQPDWTSDDRYSMIGSDFGYYYGYGGGVQYRILPGVFAQLGLSFTEGSAARVVDLNSASLENGVVNFNYNKARTTGFTEYTLGLYFRIGNHDQSQRRQRNTRRNNNRNRRIPTYWDRG